MNINAMTNYELIQQKELKDLKSEGYLLRHKKDVYKRQSTGIAGEKKAATETLYFDVVTDAATRIAGLQNGQYDIAEEIPADNYEELSKDESLKMSVERGGTLNLFLNTTEGIMADVNMRQAILCLLYTSRRERYTTFDMKTI